MTEVKAFNTWLQNEPSWLDDLDDLDEALVQYSFEHKLSKSRVGNLYAGVALAIPKARHKLPWLGAVLHGLQRLAPSMHTLPMPRPAALVLAVVLAQHGHLFASVVLIVQSAFGLRPSEALSITPASIVFPLSSFYEAGLIVLKHGSKTKSGRPESVRLFRGVHQLELALLHWCTLIASSSQTIAGNLTTSGYTSLLAKFSALLDLPPYSGHSARAGFATDQSMAGMSVNDIMNVTRHQCSKSLATYVDNASNVAQTTWGKVAPWVPTAKLIQQHPEQWFPQLGTYVRKISVNKR